MRTEQIYNNRPIFMPVNLCLLMIASFAALGGCDSETESAEPASSGATGYTKPTVATAEYPPEQIQEQTEVGYILGAESARKVKLVLNNITDLPEGWSRFSSMNSAQAAAAVLASSGLNPDHPPADAPAGQAVKDHMTESMISGFNAGFADQWESKPIKYAKQDVFTKLGQKYGDTPPEWLRKK